MKELIKFRLCLVFDVISYITKFVSSSLEVN